MSIRKGTLVRWFIRLIVRCCHIKLWPVSQCILTLSVACRNLCHRYCSVVLWLPQFPLHSELLSIQMSHFVFHNYMEIIIITISLLTWKGWPLPSWYNSSMYSDRLLRIFSFSRSISPSPDFMQPVFADSLPYLLFFQVCYQNQNLSVPLSFTIKTLSLTVQKPLIVFEVSSIW